MPFPSRLLTDGEEVVVELRPHWVTLGWPLVTAVAAIVLAIGVVAAFPTIPIGVVYLLVAIVVVAALWLAGRMVRWFTTSLVVTTSRIVQRSGVLARRGLELRLERVNQLSYHQSLLDRMLRTGELLVEMGGEMGVVAFDHVPRPAVVQSLITEQIDAVHHRARGGSPGDTLVKVGASVGTVGVDTPPEGIAPVQGPWGGARSVADRLVELDELHRRGILTDAEFQAKKVDLLERL
jgi:membrane protein YdbS with pleckstrin-like domain